MSGRATQDAGAVRKEFMPMNLRDMFRRAVGNNWTSNIQRCFDKGEASGNKSLWIPEGDYVVDRINPPSFGWHLMGRSWQATNLRSRQGDTVLFIDRHYTCISDLQIIGKCNSGSVQDADLVVVDGSLTGNCPNCRLDNVITFNAGRHGLNVKAAFNFLGTNLQSVANLGNSFHFGQLAGPNVRLVNTYAVAVRTGGYGYCSEGTGNRIRLIEPNGMNPWADDYGGELDYRGNWGSFAGNVTIEGGNVEHFWDIGIIAWYPIGLTRLTLKDTVFVDAQGKADGSGQSIFLGLATPHGGTKHYLENVEFFDRDRAANGLPIHGYDLGGGNVVQVGSTETQYWHDSNADAESLAA